VLGERPNCSCRRRCVVGRELFVEQAREAGRHELGHRDVGEREASEAGEEAPSSWATVSTAATFVSASASATGCGAIVLAIGSAGVSTPASTRILSVYGRRRRRHGW